MQPRQAKGEVQNLSEILLVKASTEGVDVEQS